MTTAPRRTPAQPRLEALAAELRRAVEQAGVRVRHERLIREVGYHAHSGRCRLGDQEMLLLDHDLSTESRVELLADALAERDHSHLLLSEAARRLLARPRLAATRASASRRAAVAAEATEPAVDKAGLRS